MDASDIDIDKCYSLALDLSKSAGNVSLLDFYFLAIYFV